MSEYEVTGTWVRDLFESAQYTIHEHPAPTHVEWLVRDLDTRLRKVLRERSELEKRLAERDAAFDRLRGGTPWQILAPEGPSARRDGYAVVTADWSEDADRAEYYVAEQMTREVAEMLVRAGSVSPDDAHTTTDTKTWTEVHLAGQPPGGFPPYDFTFRSDHDHWRHVDDFLNRITLDWTDVHVERRTVSTTTRTTDWKAETP